MRMQNVEKGFTLIELMIVVAILGILAAIALPAYRTFTVNSANSACLDEARSYMHVAVANLASQQAATAFNPGACVAISAVPVFADYNNGAPIDFTPKSPGNKNTRCNAGSAACVIL